MSAIPFGTLQLARKLEQSGFSRQQAEGLADAFAGFVAGDLATKADLREAVSGLDHKLDLLRGDLTHRAERVEGRLRVLQWAFGIALGAVLTLQAGTLWAVLSLLAR